MAWNHKFRKSEISLDTGSVNDTVNRRLVVSAKLKQVPQMSYISRGFAPPYSSQEICSEWWLSSFVLFRFLNLQYYCRLGDVFTCTGVSYCVRWHPHHASIHHCWWKSRNEAGQKRKTNICKRTCANLLCWIIVSKYKPLRFLYFTTRYMYCFTVLHSIVFTAILFA